MDLTYAVFLLRNENGFGTISSNEKLEISNKSPVFHRLLKKKKILSTWKTNEHKIRFIYWPILIDGECAACFVLGLQTGEFRLTNDQKLAVELLADQAVDLLLRKKLWEKIQATNRQAVFDWMSTAMVHEIRNPLTALETLIQLLPQKREDPFFMDEFQKIMKKEIGRLSDLTNGLLDLSGADPEKMTIVDLKDIIRQIIQLMGPLFFSKKIQLKVKASKNLYLKGNETQLKSLLINLLQNAFKAVESEGVVELSTHFLAKSPRGPNWLKIQVKDNGRGISKENMVKIFSPFFSEDHLGTGLGLAICQRITENHKGYMEVKSQFGKGTVFSLCFPSIPSFKKIKNLPF